jgi:hypothetical protein
MVLAYAHVGRRADLSCATLSFHFLEQPLLRLKDGIGHTPASATRLTDIVSAYAVADPASRLPEGDPS